MLGVNEVISMMKQSDKKSEESSLFFSSLLSLSHPLSPPSLLCCLYIYHDITVMENAHMQYMKWKVGAELKSAKEKHAGVLH